MEPTEKNVRESIVEYLVSTANVAPEQLASGDVPLIDLNVDSLSAVEMLWTLETTYGVELPANEQSLGALTIDGLVGIIMALQADRARAPVPTAGAL